MAILAAWSFDLGTILNIFYVAVGLTFVILFHELGHFAVAKWCDVQVERFSIGFGPILLRYKRGETEYALSAIPFGGYVKMLGQDDTDPSQMSAEEIAQDPRAYSAKTVPQRMGIISAGVIMNIITGMLFFATGFGIGVEQPAPVIGHVDVGLPAWKAGLESGDTVTSVNGRKTEVFGDITRAVALSAEKTIVVEGTRYSSDPLKRGEPFKLNIQSDSTSSRPRIGVGPIVSMRLISPDEEGASVTVPGTAAAEAKPPFQAGDVVYQIDKTKVQRFPDLREYLARKRDQIVRFHVYRKGKKHPVPIIVKPRKFRTFGLWMGIGPITAVKQGSPADKIGLRPDDKIVKVDGQMVGTEINPLQLPDYFAGKHGQKVEIIVERPVKGADAEEKSFSLLPLDKPGWIEKPYAGEPLSIPAIGIAFQLTSTVLHVVEKSPAAGKIHEEDRIQKMELILPKGAAPDGYKDKDQDNDRIITVKFDKKNEDGETIHNWAQAFWLVQSCPTRKVKLYVRSPGKGDADKVRTVPLDPRAVDPNWYLPTRGFRLELKMEPLKADSVVDAVGMGWTHTFNTGTDIYLTLRSLFTGRIDPTELHGPVGIATVAYKVASQGIADLLLFFGFLSVNLAVLNFLPIPVLDGGHMFFLIWEAVTRKKPSERILVAATYTGMVMILGLMVFVLYLDFFVHWLPGK